MQAGLTVLQASSVRQAIMFNSDFCGPRVSKLRVASWQLARWAYVSSHAQGSAVGPSSICICSQRRGSCRLGALRRASCAGAIDCARLKCSTRGGPAACVAAGTNT